jgi:hypothetical protein
MQTGIQQRHYRSAARGPRCRAAGDTGLSNHFMGSCHTLWHKGDIG